jgi:hypothetical protein
VNKCRGRLLEKLNLLELVISRANQFFLWLKPAVSDATYSFVVNPGFDSVIGPGDPLFPATAPVIVRYVQPLPDAPLDPLPLDGSPGQAFASHTVRARAIARHFVRTRRMNGPTGIADENSSIASS